MVLTAELLSPGDLVYPEIERPSIGIELMESIMELEGESCAVTVSGDKSINFLVGSVSDLRRMGWRIV